MALSSLKKVRPRCLIRAWAHAYVWHLKVSFFLLLLALLSAPDLYAADKRAMILQGGATTTALKDYQAFGETFAQTLRNNDMEKLAQLYDIEKFAYEVAELVTEKPSEKKGFVKGFLQSKDQMLVNLFGSVSQQKAMVKYLRTIKSEGVLKPLIRIDIPGGGHDYALLSMGRNKNNDLVAIDMFLATSGKKSSEAIAEATQLMVAPNDSILSRLLNIKRVDDDMVEKFRVIGKLRQQGKFSEAYSLFKKLPDDVRTSRAILDLGIGLSQNINDTEYKKQLGLLAKYYANDDSTLFMLVDYYYFQQEYDKAMASLDRMLEIFGEDAVLYNLKAATAMYSKDTQAAIGFAKKAMQLEPDFIDAYWSLVALLNKNKQYSEMISVFKTMEQDFGYTFAAESFYADEFYADFSKSAAFKKWLD